MSSPIKKAAKVKRDVSPRPTNEQLFQEYLQKGMNQFQCAIAATPIVAFGQDGCLRLVETKFSIVPMPKQAPAAPAASKAIASAKPGK